MMHYGISRRSKVWRHAESLWMDEMREWAEREHGIPRNDARPVWLRGQAERAVPFTNRHILEAVKFYGRDHGIDRVVLHCLRRDPDGVVLWGR